MYIYSVEKKHHKPLVNSFSKSRPILSAITTGMWKWSKFFVSLLKQFTSNDYKVNHSFNFTKDISGQNSKLYMDALDVDSLFAKVTLDKIIDICVKEIFKTSQMVSALNKQYVLEILSITTKENIILFDEHYYSQIDGIAIGHS